jgi:conjugative transfer pilus assembly protein TraH
MLSDLFAKTSKMLYTAQIIMNTQDNPTGANGAATCRIKNVEAAAQRIQTMMDKASDLLAKVRGDYATTLSEINALETFVKRRKDFSNSVRSKLRQKFNPGLAERVTQS